MGDLLEEVDASNGTDLSGVGDKPSGAYGHVAGRLVDSKVVSNDASTNDIQRQELHNQERSPRIRSGAFSEGDLVGCQFKHGGFLPKKLP